MNNIFIANINKSIQFAETESGDLYYIEVNTLENKTFFITANEKGFFVNKSKKDDFNSLPTSYTSYTLPGLLSLISNAFKENFTKTVTQEVSTDYIMFSPSPCESFNWLTTPENPFYYDFRFKKFSSKLTDNILLNKEWNEEYQGINDIKYTETSQIVTKERLLVTFYQQFKQIALEGAKLIIEKKLKSFNLYEIMNSGYYMYGNIFLTILEDSYNDFKVI